MYEVPAVSPLITILPVADAQLVGLVGLAVMEGTRLTVMVNTFDGPLQFAPLFVFGVTVIVAMTGVVPVFIAGKEVMSPEPLAANPMLVLLFVHVYPLPVPEKMMVVVLAPLQTLWFAGCVTVGLGLTVTVKLDWLLQPELVAVTLMVELMGDAVVLVAVKVGMGLVVPKGCMRPIPVFEFVQLKFVVPEELLENAKGPTGLPGQVIMLAGTVRLGRGLTVID